MNYYDILLAKKLNEGSGGDITVEELSVNENRTYTAPTGKAYSPVVVNVPAPPLPNNAYLLNDIEDLPKDIATFSDGANLPLASLKVGIEPIQEGSGDPSPTNIRPISGWDEVDVSVNGANVWDEEWENGYWNVNTGHSVENNNYIRCKNYIPITPNNTYKLANSATSTVKNEVLFFDKDKNIVSYVDCMGGANFTTPSNCYFIKFYMNINYGSIYNNDISINYPSTDTSYHAYNGHTYTIPFTDSQGNPIEVFGGELDVVNGVLTVDRVLNTIDQNSTIQFRSTGRALTFITDAYNTVTMGGVNLICDKLKSAYYSNYDSAQNGEIATVSGSTAQTGISFKISDSITSLDELKAWLTSNPLTIVTNLATPLTIQLTPTAVKSLLGSNNVWGDCGQISEGQYFSKEV